MELECDGSVVRLRGARKALEGFMESYLRKVYEYNSAIRGSGYYLKPVHVVVKRGADGSRRVYLYYGRYWWKVVYAGKRGGTSLVRWVYQGRVKPPGLPDPPVNPLEGLKLRVEGDDLLLDRSVLERYWGLLARALGISGEPRC